MSDETSAGGLPAVVPPPVVSRQAVEDQAKAIKMEFFAKLAFPFDPEQVKTRKQGNIELAYVTARTVMNRLDEVAGPWGWEDRYERHDNAWLCRLTLWLPDGSTLTKEGIGGESRNMQDSSDVEKSGESDAFKRAAVKFGIGRYLYDDGVPKWIRERFHRGKGGAK
ncbi:Rad52/Rad22 family DNA repair protein [Paludisphaera rhizosphaerae]|uniref:Rad52/Rad22 family DNA repair protein n=1 Tax=Paludisphaera rhizosphaerae TaxID=2711216 RepID=UPI001F0EAFBF|nr:Rad52/Rad22 family DNA repair protein [Paludisphaera rhizosphaerae]